MCLLPVIKLMVCAPAGRCGGSGCAQGEIEWAFRMLTDLSYPSASVERDAGLPGPAGRDGRAGWRELDPSRVVSPPLENRGWRMLVRQAAASCGEQCAYMVPSNTI